MWLWRRGCETSSSKPSPTNENNRMKEEQNSMYRGHTCQACNSNRETKCRPREANTRQTSEYCQYGPLVSHPPPFNQLLASTGVQGASSQGSIAAREIKSGIRNNVPRTFYMGSQVGERRRRNAKCHAKADMSRRCSAAPADAVVVPLK